MEDPPTDHEPAINRGVTLVCPECQKPFTAQKCPYCVANIPRRPEPPLVGTGEP